MSKGEDNKLHKFQACVLKVNIHCDGCEEKVRKLLHKTEGVYTINIDAEQGKVTVVGCVDPATLIRKLNKAGKHAEEWPTKRGNHNHTNQLQKLQIDHEHAKGLQKNNGKPQKGGAGGKDKRGQQPQKQQQQKQGRGFKDLKFPNLKDFKFPFKKRWKSTKSDLPSKECCGEGNDYGDYSDEFDDDEDFDDLDELDEEFYDDPKMVMKPLNIQQHGNGVVNDKKASGGGGNGKKGEEVQLPNKVMEGGHSGKGGGGKKGGGNSQNHAGDGGKNGAVAHGRKNGGWNSNGKGGHDSAGNSANNNNPHGGGKKGGGKIDGMGGGHIMGQPNMMGQGFQGMDLVQMGNMQPDMGHMGNIPAVQRLPAGSAPTGYFQGGVVPPEMMAVPNPYQQQYLQALLQQQQQQRMMMNMHGGAAYPQMGYGYGRPAYAPPFQSHGEPYTMFSDENPNSCSIM